MINKEDSKVRDKIHDLADRDKPENDRNFPLDTSLDYSRKDVRRTLTSEVFSISDLESSSAAVVYDEKNLDGKRLGPEIDSYDEVVRFGVKEHDIDEIHIGRRTDFQILKMDGFIYQNVYQDSDVIVPNLDDEGIPEIFYDALEGNSNLFELTGEFVRFLANFRDVHSLETIPDYLISVLLSLRLFDVVHFYGLDPYSLDLENLIFSFHFKGFITLKDIYE